MIMLILSLMHTSDCNGKWNIRMWCEIFYQTSSHSENCRMYMRLSWIKHLISVIFGRKYYDLICLSKQMNLILPIPNVLQNYIHFLLRNSRLLVLFNSYNSYSFVFFVVFSFMIFILGGAFDPPHV